MIWGYNTDYRDRFNEGPHRNILIVPHATLVTPVPGGPPEVRSKIPKFQEGEEGQPIQNEYKDLDFVIENDDIIKEKWEYTSSINSGSNLAFGTCDASMVKLTIRNNKNKVYIGDGDEEEDTDPSHFRWEPEIPNLQTLEVISDDGKTLVGEVQAAAVIEVYTYIDGDSSTLMWNGMYKVEQDKITDNGHEREIVAYDFMYTLRDMDIYNWYIAKFEGTPVDSDDPSKGKMPNSGKTAYKDEWTIGELLQDLFANLCEYHPNKATTSNPKDYMVDLDASDYPGYGMPIKLDPDMFDTEVPELVIPSDAEEGAYERYGYMPILNLKVRIDENIKKKGALSCGKFLEDIAMLAGRFGIIRCDIREQQNFDPGSGTNPGYNLYDRCILSFRSLPRKDEHIDTENIFDDSEVEKGLKYDYYDAKEVKLIDIYNYDNKRIIFYCPSGLKKSTKQDYKAGKRSDLAILKINDNMFVSYLNVEKTKDKTGHSDIIEMLKEGASGIYGGKPLLSSCFSNITNRPYRPFELKTSGDLCRQPGDMIKVSGIDKISGEYYEFTSYILQRKITGIQKQMDSYNAKGDISNKSFSDYRSGDTYNAFSPQSIGYRNVGGGSGSNESTTDGTSSEEITVQGLTLEDYYEYARNWGFRFLDDPTGVEVIYNEANKSMEIKWTDPADISNEKPCNAIWAGTVVVRKKGGRPKHRWDGTLIVDSTVRDQYKTNGYVDSSNIKKDEDYYYGIFPYDTKGNYRVTTVVKVNTTKIEEAPEITKIKMGGTSDWDGSEIAILYSGDNSSLTVQVSNGHIVFKLYLGNTEIYSFTSPVGSSINDVNKIHVSFLKDDTNYLAKPSFIYETANGVYSYNQESPTNIEMENICSWLNDDGVLYDIVNVTKTNGALTPYQEYNQSTYFIYNLRQYFGTGNVLRVTTKPSATRTYTYDNGVYTLAENDTETLICIPLNERCYVKSVSCKVRLSSSTTNRYYVLFVSCIDSDGVAEQNNNKIAEYAVEKTGGSYYGGLVVNDTNWHTIRFDVNGYADYICFDISYSSAQIKDVVIGLV